MRHHLSVPTGCVLQHHASKKSSNTFPIPQKKGSPSRQRVMGHLYLSKMLGTPSTFGQAYYDERANNVFDQKYRVRQQTYNAQEQQIKKLDPCIEAAQAIARTYGPVPPIPMPPQSEQAQRRLEFQNRQPNLVQPPRLIPFHPVPVQSLNPASSQQVSIQQHVMKLENNVVEVPDKRSIGRKLIDFFMGKTPPVYQIISPPEPPKTAEANFVPSHNGLY